MLSLRNLVWGNFSKACVYTLQESSYLYLVMEYCAGGDLAGYIRRCKRVPEVTACAVMRQLGAGLKELWSRHMVHVGICINLLLAFCTQAVHASMFVCVLCICLNKTRLHIVMGVTQISILCPA